MQQYPIYSVDDLVANASFKKWILYKEEAAGVYWQQWLLDNPDKLEWVAAARTLVILLNSHTHTVSQEEVNDAAGSIQKQLYEEIEEPAVVKRMPVWKYWLSAAAVILILFTGSLLYYHRYSTPAGDMLSANAPRLMFENTADTTLTVLLPDGSKVYLEKGSRLVYADDDSLKQRVASLSGNAFFDIAHNASHPFLVYTNSIVTRVLGTSFWVHAAPGTDTASVVVKTGKVSVCKKEDLLRQKGQPGVVQAVIVSANQQVSYDLARDRVHKALVAVPLATSAKADSLLYFDAEPAVAAFKHLEEVYGIPIVLDEKALSGCSITAVLGNENFYEKLNMLCKVINASYEVIDGAVVIASEGCK